MCARWPARCAATAISCCPARAIRFGCRPARAPTATAPAFISTSIPGARALSADLDGVLSFEARAPRFEGALMLAAPAGLKAERRCSRSRRGGSPPRSRPIRPPRGSSSSRRATAPEERALKLAGQRRRPLRRLAAAARRAVGAAARCRQIRRQGQQRRRAASAVAGIARADGRDPAGCRSRRKSSSAPSRSCWAAVRCRMSPPICRATPHPGRIDRLDFRAPGATPRVPERRERASRPPVSPARSAWIPPIRMRW